MSNIRLIQSNNTRKNEITYEELERFQFKLIEDWERQQVVKGYTIETVSLNLRNIKEFIEFVNKFIWNITPEDVEKFYYSLVGKGLAHSTRRKYQSNISTFYQFLKGRKGIEVYEYTGKIVPDLIDDFNKFYHRKDDENAKVIPPQKEILDLFFEGLKSNIMTNRKYYTISRDYVFFKTLFLTGLRLNEMIMLDITDIRFDLGSSGKIHVRFGKGSKGSGNKARWVPMLSGVNELLDWYLKEILPGLKGNNKDNALFLSESGVRVNRDTMRSNLIRRQEQVGIPANQIFSAHQLRHAFATFYVEQGVDILTMKELLGHASVATTASYITPSSDYIEQRIKISQKKWKNALYEYLKEDDDGD